MSFIFAFGRKLFKIVETGWGREAAQVNNTRSLVSMHVQTYNSYKRCFALRKAAPL